ncbi:hypothetical protein STEG23_023559 [Scotinomys teguina]
MNLLRKRVICERDIQESCYNARQKDGSCFHIHSVNLSLLLVGKIFFNDFVEYVFCAFELVFFSFFYPYYSKPSHVVLLWNSLGLLLCYADLVCLLSIVYIFGEFPSLMNYTLSSSQGEE